MIYASPDIRAVNDQLETGNNQITYNFFFENNTQAFFYMPYRLYPTSDPNQGTPSNFIEARVYGSDHTTNTDDSPPIIGNYSDYNVYYTSTPALRRYQPWGSGWWKPFDFLRQYTNWDAHSIEGLPTQANLTNFKEIPGTSLRSEFSETYAEIAAAIAGGPHDNSLIKYHTRRDSALTAFESANDIATLSTAIGSVWSNIGEIIDDINTAQGNFATLNNTIGTIPAGLTGSLWSNLETLSPDVNALKNVTNGPGVKTVMLKATSTSATQVELTIDGATASATNRVRLEPGKTYSVLMQLLGRGPQTGTPLVAKTASWTRFACFKNVNGVITEVAGSDQYGAAKDSNATAYLYTLTKMDNTTGDDFLKLTATGGSETANWVARLQIIETSN